VREIGLQYSKDGGIRFRLETLVTIYQTACHHISENCTHQDHRCEKLSLTNYQYIQCKPFIFMFGEYNIQNTCILSAYPKYFIIILTNLRQLGGEGEGHPGLAIIQISEAHCRPKKAKNLEQK
jgi:hypothetical protein